MSSFKTNRLIFAISALIIGIILLIWPGTSLMIIGRCIGAVLAVGGIVAGFLFWKDHEAMSRTLLLVMAAVMLICGVVIIFHPDELVKLIPTIMGILAVMSGVINIGETVLLNKQKYGKWWISLLVAALKIAAGLFVIRNAFDLVAVITRVAGGVMIFSGASDLWVLSRLIFAEKQAAAVKDSAAAGSASAAAGSATAAGGDSGSMVNEQAAPAAKPVDAAAAPAAAPVAPSDATAAPTAPSAAPAAPLDAAGTNPASAADTTPIPHDTANEQDAAAAASDPLPADTGNPSPSLVWDDGGADAGSGEVPEYMHQEEQPGDYKVPGEDA